MIGTFGCVVLLHMNHFPYLCATKRPVKVLASTGTLQLPSNSLTTTHGTASRVFDRQPYPKAWLSAAAGDVSELALIRNC